jgi:hypothetical protein
LSLASPSTSHKKECACGATKTQTGLQLVILNISAAFQFIPPQVNGSLHGKRTSATAEDKTIKKNQTDDGTG